MKWWYHWHLAEITGYFDNSSGGDWVVCVNKSPVNPELLAGRKITIKGQPRRLGRYLHTIGTVSYFDPWPGKDGEDFTPTGRAAKLLARWKQEPTPAGEVPLRQELKTAGAVARVAMGKTDWPIRVFERYALEPLEAVILELNARGLYAAPINDLHESKIDGLKLLADLAAALASGARTGRPTKNF